MEQAKILIVDDDPDIVEALKMTLEAHQYQVFTAANGTEGLKQVKAVKPDLIILDVMMDTVTEGFQVTYQLRNSDPKSEYAPFSKIPILMLTAIADRKQMKFNTKKDGDFLPVDDFVEKPIRPQVLLEKVRKMIEK
jgi:CheY-like chemotaxis protein